MLSSRNEENLQVAAEAIQAETGREVSYVVCDMAKTEDIQKAIAKTAEEFGRLDVLVNCAGVCSFGEFGTSSEEIVRRVLEVNFFAPAELIRVAAPHLTRSFETARDGWRPAVEVRTRLRLPAGSRASTPSPASRGG